jgi:hypothetical protein
MLLIYFQTSRTRSETSWKRAKSTTALFLRQKNLLSLNSLFLLRTSANTISCTTVAHIQDALNGKEIDWPGLFYEYIKAEFITGKNYFASGER